ncbi:hypothetical protein DCCM_2203 [Desulfocucumis palustris]|uniref:Uncharacterized protein n=1 Tax=Desulfocucumis palustris TaxID=1898651 RepID=A0A2L2XFU9_9FIRM|nr:hypothetical protein DCCM_2203 [Desulfocucumis palustris]
MREKAFVALLLSVLNRLKLLFDLLYHKYGHTSIIYYYIPSAHCPGLILV